MHRTTTALLPLLLITAVAACSSSAVSTPATGSRSTATSAPQTTSTSALKLNPNAPEVVAPGDIPDTQVFVPYTTADYTVTVPEGWSQSIVGPTTTYSDHYNTIRIETTPSPAAPTVATVQSTEIPTLSGTVPSFELGKVTSVNRTAGAAVLVTYRAGSTPDPVTNKRVALDVERYEFWRSGTLVTLILSGARGSDNVDPWKTVTESFAWAK